MFTLSGLKGFPWLQGSQLKSQGLDSKCMMWQFRIIFHLQENCRQSGKCEVLYSLIQISNIRILENKEQEFKVYIS